MKQIILEVPSKVAHIEFNCTAPNWHGVGDNHNTCIYIDNVEKIAYDGKEWRTE